MAIIKYTRGEDGVVRETVSHDGGKTYSSTGANSSNNYSGGYEYVGSGNSASSSSVSTRKPTSNKTTSSTIKNTAPTTGSWNTSGDKWTNMSGADGSNYAVSSDNGTIIVTGADGTQTRYLPTDANYNQHYANMQNQVGNSYTPTYNWTTANGTNVTTQNYLLGNSDLQYALNQANKASGSNTYDVEGYVKSLYDRIGSQRENGSTVTLADIDKELNRLGLNDYNSQNAIYTAGGTLLPNNQFVTNKNGAYGSNSPDSTWASYGGQDYLLGGDSANYAQYVNGKTGNVDNLALIFGNMANNPYAMQDPEFLMQYNQNLNNFNNAAGIQSSAPQGSITGNVNVDNVINYGNSLGNYNQATGGSLGTVNLLEMLQSYLNSGLEANQDFLAQQRALAEEQAQKQASDAYVNKVLAGDAMQQQLSALGLGTSGALQSAQMGIQGNYGNNLADIQQNLYAMLNGLSEQELGILTDYYNNMANYAYDVTQYEADQAYRNAQLALQQQQAIYDEAYRRQQQLLQQQQWEYEKAMSDKAWDFEQKKYEDELAEKLNKSSAKKSSGGSVNGGGDTTSVYGDTGNTNLGIVDGITVPEVNSAEWQALLNDAALKQQIGLNYLDELSNVSTTSAPSANMGQLTQQAMDAYNNAVASVPTGTVNQSELLRQLKQAISMVENGYY